MESKRYQKSLQGVLKLAIDNSNGEEQPDSTKPNQLDEEKRKFLENALKSMTVDVVKELEKSIRCLESDTTSDQDKIEALNVVRDYADNIDFANNFVQIGGSKVLLDCLKSDNSKLRISAAYVVAELSQNNPFCQKHFIESEVLKLFMLYAKEDGDAASSSMHAISSLVRSYEEGCVKFIELGGLHCILASLKSQQSNVFVKSCFLLRAICVEHPSVRDKFVKLGAVSVLANCIDAVGGYDVRIEIVLSALEVLTQSDEGKDRLRRANVYSVLQNLIEINNGKAECEEILKDSAALLSCLNQEK